MGTIKKILFVTIILFAFILRIYQLDKFPPGFYSDETAFGYNAYSLLQTGRDEFNKAWPLTLKSFGDYKPPMSAWLALPTIAIFGLSELAVRLPSVLLGTLTIIVVFFLTRETVATSELKFLTSKQKEYVPYVSSILLAISPWHLLFSRSSMLVGIEIFFVSSGFLFFLIGLRKPMFLFLSSICFSLAVYSYYGSRITVPLLLLALAIIFRKELAKIKLIVGAGVILGFLLLLPLILAISKDPSSLTGRAKTISVFFDPGINLKLWEAHTRDGQNFPILLGRFFHNKPYFYFRDISRRYLQHFSFDFLFLTGDKHPPFKIPDMGVVYIIEFPLFLYGFFLATRRLNKYILALFAYLLLSPVAASFTFITPSANRAFNMIIPWTIISAFGLVLTIDYLRNRFRMPVKISAAIFLSIYTLLLSIYLYQYYFATAQYTPQIWHYGRNELVRKIGIYEKNYNEVLLSDMSNNEGPVYIWLLFYKRYNPQEYWQSASINEVADNLGWIHVNSFDKYRFIPEFDWQKVEKKPGTLYIGSEEKIPDKWTGVLDGKTYSLIVDDRIIYPNGWTAFKIAHLSEI